MKQIPEDFSIQQAMELAKTPQGQAILAYLRQNYGSVSPDELTDAAPTIQKLQADPVLQALLRGEQHG